MIRALLITTLSLVFNVGCEPIPRPSAIDEGIQDVASTNDAESGRLLKREELSIQMESADEPRKEVIDACEGKGCDGVWLIEATSCSGFRVVMKAREEAFGGDARPLIGVIKLEDLPSAIQLQLPNGISPMMYVAEQGKVVDFQWSGFSDPNANIQRIRNMLVRSNVVKGDVASFRFRWGGDVSYEFSDLSGADLSGMDLSNRRMIKFNLSGSDLSQADLSHSDLSGAFLRHTDLTGANISGTDFTNATFQATTCPDGTVTNSGC